MSEVRVTEVRGFNGSAVSLRVRCRCGAIFETGVVRVGDIIICPNCGRRYRYKVEIRLEEVNKM